MTTTVTGNSRSARPEYRFSLERLDELNRSPYPVTAGPAQHHVPIVRQDVSGRSRIRPTW